MKRFFLKLTGCLEMFDEAVAKAKALQDKYDSIEEEHKTIGRAYKILKKKLHTAKTELENERKAHMELREKYEALLKKQSRRNHNPKP